MLQALKPDILDAYVPLSIVGDGNCLFRTLSRALFGTEGQHALIRLLTDIKILCFPMVYAVSRPDYDDVIGDHRIHVPCYCDALEAACKMAHSVS